MRSFDETDEWDREECARLKPAPWMMAALELNPSYVGWGPHEDYMWNKSEGWNGPVIVEDWASFKFELDDLNECCNFYFEVQRDARACGTCAGKGEHPDAQWITESFYRHSSPFKMQTEQEAANHALLRSFGGHQDPEPPSPLAGRFFPDAATLAKYGAEFKSFCEKMRTAKSWGDGPFTSDEIAALDEAGRGGDRGPLGHDAINRGILCEARCKRLGVPYRCPACDGHGEEFTEDAAHLGLVLWWMHPRKGATRGIEIKRITEGELPQALAFIAEAAQRNADRFSKAVAAAKVTP